MAPITLYYFNVAGRAEAIRIALFLGGIEFEDKRLSWQEFRSSEFKYLPVLQMDGINYGQSTALLRYVGKLAGLLPEDPLEALKARESFERKNPKVDEVVMTLEDLSNLVGATEGIKDKEIQLEARKALVEGKMKAILETLEAKKSADAISTFFFGESITIADLMIHAIVLTFESGVLDSIPQTIVSDFAPSLKKIQLAVMDNPQVNEWYALKA